MSTLRVAGLFFLACFASPPVFAAAIFSDPIDTPARISRLAESGPQTAVVAAGGNFVSVGPRGQILISEPGSATWKQVPVPVSADLTAVYFVTPLLGWAVGHDAVVLHSSDGGKSWVKQLDGRAAARLMRDFYKKRVDGGDTTAATALAEAQSFVDIDGGRPLLGVWFRDAKNGFVVGSFNLIFRTSDGGATWEPWFHRTENARLSTLYAVAGDTNDVYLVGEQGLLMKLDAANERFRLVKTPYEGSFFGALIPSSGAVVAFGMRGNVFASRDGGASWSQVATNDAAGVTAGAVLAGGRYVVATQSGQLLFGSISSIKLDPLPAQKPTAFSGVAMSADGRLGTAGWGGVSIQKLTP
jgi:photosystem II stability/assembly factor-like uncharacterized protein